jgi:hypothetical protein
MPLLAGGVPPPPPPPEPVPQVSDAPEVTWYAPDGTVWPLTTDSLGWHTLDEVTGWGAAPVRLTTDAHPRGGAKVRHVQAQPRLLTWPLFVRGSNHMQMVARWRDLVRAFTMTRRLGAGVLRVARPDGSAREIAAFYQEGFAGEPGQGWVEDSAALTLFCEDPFWRDVTAVTLTREFAGASTPFLDPFPTISNAQVLGDTELFNRGEVEAWPQWTLTGPATSLEAVNNTTGEQFTLTATLGEDEQATITTDPPSVRGPAGENWTGNLDWPGAALWGLAPGINEVEFTVDGADVGTRLELSFVPRYETA